MYDGVRADEHPTGKAHYLISDEILVSSLDNNSHMYILFVLLQVSVTDTVYFSIQVTELLVANVP